MRRPGRSFRGRSTSVLLGALVGLLASAALAAEPEAEPAAEEAAAGAQSDGEPGAASPPEQAPAKAERPPPAAAPAPAAQDQGAALQAYQAALAAKNLAASTPLTLDLLRERLAAAEAQLLDGRRDEAIAALSGLVESPRFEPFASSAEGRAAVFSLGDALGDAGAEAPARAYLTRLLRGPTDTWQRRATQSLVDLGLESSKPQAVLDELERAGIAAADLRGDLDYLRGRVLEQAGQRSAALERYKAVDVGSRYWAQATYLAGLLEVETGRLKEGEQLFCKIADPKQTPRRAALVGGSDFFQVRDMARLALGRVAHEQFRFDDARYYYYLVPADSERLPEALYEAATSRYEAKDYDGARELLAQLRSLSVHHPYEDEVFILEAYLDLSTCHFPEADAKLRAFLRRYEPVQQRVRRLSRDPSATERLLAAVRAGSDPASAGVPGDPAVLRTIAALLRLDPDYARAARRLGRLDHQISGLTGAVDQLAQAAQSLRDPKHARAESAAIEPSDTRERARVLRAQIDEVRRLLAGAKGAQVAELRRELEGLELRVRALERVGQTGEREVATGSDLGSLITADAARAESLRQQALSVRAKLEQDQLRLAKNALVRADRRLSRLLARARLGRIETVLGKKRALEVEIEALSQGYLPRSMVDSLDAARYLRDDEEYWPYDGEDWEDEYVGGEGLK